MECIYRPIEASDNVELANIIRKSIELLGLPTEGTAHSDPTTDDLFTLFKKPLSHYFVAEINGIIQGGCGIYPSNGLPSVCTELVRFFLNPQARGKGIGSQLMKLSIQEAILKGYTKMYIESFPDMEAAIHLYKKAGFKYLDKPMGNTGHFSCNVWMQKNLI